MSTTAPERAPSPASSEQLPTELRPLTVEKIEELRAAQQALREKALEDVSVYDVDRYNKTIADTNVSYGDFNRDFLAHQGATEDNTPKELYETYLQRYDELSLHRIPEDEWLAGPRKPDGSLDESGHEKARHSFEAFQEQFETGKREAEEREQREREEEERQRQEEKQRQEERARLLEEKRKNKEAKELTIDELKQNIEDIRNRFAMLASERSKRILSSSNLEADMTAAREELTDEMNALATELMDSLEAEGASKKAMQDEIAAFLAEQIDDTVAEMEANRAAEFERQRPIIQKFLSKWASWGGGGDERFFSKERWKGNLIKGAVLAPVTVTAGVIGGAVAAPLAVGVAGVLTGSALVAVGTRSIARAMVGAKIDKRANAATVAHAQAEDMRSHMKVLDERMGQEELPKEGDSAEVKERKKAELTTDPHAELLKVIQERSEEYRKRNLRRFIGGTGIALTAGLLSASLAEALSQVSPFSRGPGEVPDRGRNGVQPNGTPEPTTPPTEPEAPVQPERPEVRAQDLFTGSGGTTEFTPEGLNDFERWVNGYKVESGDSIWRLSEEYLQEKGISDPDNFKIDAAEDKILADWRERGLVPDSGRQAGWLFEGDTIQISGLEDQATDSAAPARTSLIDHASDHTADHTPEVTDTDTSHGNEATLAAGAIAAAGGVLTGGRGRAPEGYSGIRGEGAKVYQDILTSYKVPKLYWKTVINLAGREIARETGLAKRSGLNWYVSAPQNSGDSEKVKKILEKYSKRSRYTLAA